VSDPPVIASLASSSIDARGVCRVRIERPEKLNSLDSATAAALIEAVTRASAEPRLRVVVLTGAGDKAFIGGANIEELKALTPQTARGVITRLHDCCAALRACPVPVVARINGWCLGAGMEIAASCDFRIASGNARFGMPEVKLGIPSVIEAALLPRLVGAGRARWLVMTGETITAEEALRWAFLERVVPLAELDREVDASVEAILGASDAAIRAQKKLQDAYEELPLEQAIQRSIDAFAASYASPEPGKLIEAFLAQRRRKR
jgi:enoyl-CoA hydratase